MMFENIDVMAGANFIDHEICYDHPGDIAPCMQDPSFMMTAFEPQ